jgi:hypothetical protein
LIRCALANTFTSSTTIPTYACGLFIAVTDPALNNAYIGSLDDVRIYNWALSAADISAMRSMTSASSLVFSTSKKKIPGASNAQVRAGILVLTTG